MLDSFRGRLTVWYTIVLGLLLVLFSVGFYSLLSASVHARLDAGLASAVDVTALSLNHEIVEHGGQEHGEASVRDVLETMLGTSFPRQTVVIFDGSRFVAGKLGAEGLPLDALTEIFPAPPEPYFGSRDRGGVRYRFASREVLVPSILHRYQVLASEATTARDQELATVRQLLAICVPVGMLLAAGGGYFLARRSLEPVMAMSAAAQRISSSTLHERLDVRNPRDELGKLAATFNRLLERLDQAFAQQRRFMADASHELRTPLSVALTATQVNLEGDLRAADDYRDALRIVSEQLTRLRRVTQDMFLLARADAGGLQPAFATLYLDEVMDDTVRAARVMGARKGAAIGWSGPREAAMWGDEGLLRQLLLILLDNAVRHIGEHGQVDITLDRQAAAYHLTVRDNGCGIPEADRPHVFDRFYRADKARSRDERLSGGGAGLGLAIAQSIVQAHGGSLALTETSPRGTVFTVVLPIGAPAARVTPARASA